MFFKRAYLLAFIHGPFCDGNLSGLDFIVNVFFHFWLKATSKLKLSVFFPIKAIVNKPSNHKVKFPSSKKHRQFHHFYPLANNNLNCCFHESIKAKIVFTFFSYQTIPHTLIPSKLKRSPKNKLQHKNSLHHNIKICYHHKIFL